MCRCKELYLVDVLLHAHLPSTDQAETTEDYDVMTVEALSRRIKELWNIGRLSLQTLT